MTFCKVEAPFTLSPEDRAVDDVMDWRLLLATGGEELEGSGKGCGCAAGA